MSQQYRYTITIDQLDKQVYPIGLDKLEYEFAREGKEVFYRKKLVSSLIFHNNRKENVDDFDFFRAIELSPTSCTEIKILIEKFCNGNWTDDWKGYFTTAMGAFDLDECTFEVKPFPDDKYRCILTNINKEINILDVTTEHTSQADLDTGTVYEYFPIRGNGIVVNTQSPLLPIPTNSWQILHTEVDHAGVGDTICIYFREKITTGCVQGVPVAPPGDNWMLLSDDCGTDGNSTWVRQPAPVPFNPNPNVLQGVCEAGGVETPPPSYQLFNVDLVDPGVIDLGPLDDIRGWKRIKTLNTNYIFELSNPFPNSAFQWSINSGGATLVIAGVDNESRVEITFNNSFVTGTIDCVETTSCGEDIVHRLLITSGTYQPNTEMVIGPKHVCSKQLATWEIYSVYQLPNVGPHLGYPFWYFRIGAGPNYLPIGNFATIVTQNRYTFTLQFNLPFPAGTYYIIWRGDIANGGGDLSDGFQVDVTPFPQTDTVEGPLQICANSTGAVYRVNNRPGSTYFWDLILGGTIVSGQGTNEITVDWGPEANSWPILLKETIDCGCDLVPIVECNNPSQPIPYFICPDVNYDVKYTHNRSLFEVIEYMMSQLGCSDYTGDLISDLFEWNPDGTAPGYVAGSNYVYRGINDYSNLMIAQKTDIINPNASNAATKGVWTLRKLFDYLATFKIFWDIDDAGNLRIEHFLYFPFAVGLDLTAPKWSEWVKRMNKYQHDSESIPKFERFIQESLFEDFVGQEIRYDALCVSQDEAKNVVEYQIPDVTTDLNYIALEPENIEKAGFVIMACDAGDNVISRVGPLSGNLIANVPMSIAMLHDRFGKYDRYLPKGQMNGGLKNFISYKPSVKQVDLSIPLCCEPFRPNDGVVTQLSTQFLSGTRGRVLSARYELYTGTLTLKLAYSYANI